MDKMVIPNRGRVLAVIWASVALVAVLGLGLSGDGPLTEGQRAEAQTASRPSIIFILSDDQPESTLAYMPYVQNLIKARGRTFDNAFNAYPLCCPSRAIIQRGQYAHNTGVFTNGEGGETDGGYPTFDALDRENSTVATWLDAAGYRTIHIGKYMNEYDPNVHPKPPGWDVFGIPTVPAKVGETTSATFANRAMAQLREDAPKADPFYLQVGFHAPHAPNEYESKYAGMFVGERVPRVPSFDEQDVSDKPRYVSSKRPLAQQTPPGGVNSVHASCKDDETNVVQQIDCEYPRQLRNLQTVDRFVKDATDYLAAQGELANTYIVYYSDNGNHWGEHRLPNGKLTPYQTDTSFPLIIRGPRIPAGTTSNKLIGNQDIAPTFSKIAGASTASFVDGRSFLRIADKDPSNDSPWRTALYAERRYKPEWPLPRVPPWEAVREEDRIYVLHGDDPSTSENEAGFKEFYDLRSDPHELRNLAYYKEVPQATLDRLHGRLVGLRGCKAGVCRAAEDEPIP